MKKWCKAFLFLLPLLFLVAAVNWYVDSYAYLRITYDEIGSRMTDDLQNAVGLEESAFNDRTLLLACLNGQKEAKEVIVTGSSRVFTFDHTMFGTDSFYNAGLSEATIYDLWAVTGILAYNGRLPETMVIGVDAFLFNTAHNNDRWTELEAYALFLGKEMGKPELFMSTESGEPGGAKREEAEKLRNDSGGMIPAAARNTGTHYGKWLSLDYFRYNITCLPEGKRFLVSYTDDWETERYTKHYDGSVSYQEELRNVDPEEVIAMTQQTMEEQVVYRLTDYREIDEESMEMLAALIDYLKDQGVEVILYLPPYSPMLYDYIESEPDFQIALEVEREMRKFASGKQIALYGSYDPAGSGLEMTDLYDVYHVKAEKGPDTFYPVICP